jgi:hypothetical protein
MRTADLDTAKGRAPRLRQWLNQGACPFAEKRFAERPPYFFNPIPRITRSITNSRTIEASRISIQRLFCSARRSW